ncbi:MAG: TRAP transporter small permease subunit [Comamonas sp.]
MSNPPFAPHPPSRPERLLQIVGVLLFLATFSTITAGVVARYFHLPGFEWSFEIAGLSFVWVTCIGCVLAELRGENVRFVGVLLLLPAAAQRALQVFGCLVLLGVSLWLLASGWAVLERAGRVPTPVLRWPSGLMTLALVSAAALLAVIALLRLWRVLTRLEKTP